MTPDEFRQHGHQVVDWIADYYEQLETFPVLSQSAPGSIRAALPAAPPEQGEPFDAVLRDLDDVIMPGITHWQHPSFFAYFPANASGPAILGDLLASGLGVQGMLWATSPAATELETHVMEWLRELQVQVSAELERRQARRRKHATHPYPVGIPTPRAQISETSEPASRRRALGVELAAPKSGEGAMESKHMTRKPDQFGVAQRGAFELP